MRSRIASLCCVLLALSLSLSAATTRPDDRLAGFYKRNGRNWVVRWSDDGRRVTSLIGSGTRPYQGKPAEAARQFLNEWVQLFGVRSDLSDMRLLSEKTHLGGPSVEWQQIVEGKPVDNAYVTVNFDKAGRVLMVKNTYQPVQGAPPPATLTVERATEVAIERFLDYAAKDRGMAGRRRAPQQQPKAIARSELQLDGPPKVDDLFYAKPEGIVRAFRIEVKATKPYGWREFTIDARTGEVLRVRNRSQSVDGQGQVFMPDPNHSLNDNTLTAASVPTSNPNPYFTVGLLNLNPAGGDGLFHLTTPFATIADIESPSNTPTTNASATGFNFTRGGNDFAETNVLFHIDRIQRYIQSLGFIDINNRQIQIDARGFSDALNAHYVDSPPGAGYLAFGMSTVLIAEDSEAAAHEYGHSIHDNQATGKYLTLGAPAAMGEGFGDYLGVSVFLDELTAAGADVECFAIWAKVLGDGVCLRRLDNGLTNDDFDPFGDEHDNGEIWSQTLWNILQTINKTTADRLILQSHFNVPDSPTFKDGADAIMTADLQLYSGSHLSQLCQIFMDQNIYAAGDCPTVPGSTGTQSTLVVLARFNDAGLPVSPMTSTDVNNRVDAINDYLAANTYSLATLGTPSIAGWFGLGNSRAHYYDASSSNMLIDLVDDVIANAPAGTDFTTVDRMIIITNDDGSGGETRGNKEWATTGPWPYTLPAAFGTRRMSVSVHRFNHTDAQFNHAIGHHFGLIDLYPHEGVTFPRKYVNDWTNMGQNAAESAFPNTQVFSWEKGKPGWMTDANVNFIARPAPASPVDVTIPLFAQESNASNPIAIQVGLTNGAGNRAEERVSYYIEARKKTGIAFDSNLPTDGVVVYYVNEWIGQGFGPARLVDATPGDNDLTNAALKPGGTTTVNNIDGSGLTVEVLAPTGAEDYRVHVTYAPPATDVDAWINPHDSSWRSPDIWIDSAACNGGNCGFDLVEGRSETDRGDKPVSGEINRAYARVFNHGPGTAHDVRVDFYFSDPYHGIDGGDVDPDTGGNVAFNKHQFVVIPDLPPTDAGVPVFVEWTPVAQADVDHAHACVKVKIAQVTGDIDALNQASQENIDQYDITSHSPYPPVVDEFKVVNPYDHPLMVYLRADNVPVGWTATIAPPKAFIPVGGSIDAAMTIQAPLTYPVCTSETITATAWYAAGDTLVPLGGSSAQVNLKTSTELTTTTTYVPCRGHYTNDNDNNAKNCGIEVKGCTNPPRPYEHITIRYTAPDGSIVYHDVVTDANGCFEDFFVNPGGGPWSTDVKYQGDDCTATTSTRKPTVVWVPPGSGFPPIPTKGLWYSFHLGMGFPIGTMRKTLDPGPSVTLDFEYPFRDSYAITGLLGYHIFHGKPSEPNLNLTTLNVDLKRYFPVGALTGYAEIGPGWYRATGGSTSAGANLGLGLHFALQPNLALEVGSDLHVAGGKPSKRFIDTHIGASWKF